jgi:uncharacterized membrane protein YgcG
VIRDEVEPALCLEFNVTVSDKRRIFAWYPDLTDSIFYGRFNRARPGLLSVGDAFIDVPLCDLQGNATSVLRAAAAAADADVGGSGGSGGGDGGDGESGGGGSDVDIGRVRSRPVVVVAGSIT